MKDHAELKIEFHISNLNLNNVTDDILYNIKNEIANLVSAAYITPRWEFNKNLLHILIGYVKYEQFNRSNLDAIEKKIIDILNKNEFRFRLSQENIYITEVPDHFIDADNIYFEADKGSTLKNIHKFIKCDTLFVENTQKIIGNVLGLLLVKADKIVIKGSQPWIEIVERHLKGDRDILECQEELINSGFKEYAKL